MVTLNLLNMFYFFNFKKKNCSISLAKLKRMHALDEMLGMPMGWSICASTEQLVWYIQLNLTAFNCFSNGLLENTFPCINLRFRPNELMPRKKWSEWCGEIAIGNNEWGLEYVWWFCFGERKLCAIWIGSWSCNGAPVLIFTFFLVSFG